MGLVRVTHSQTDRLVTVTAEFVRPERTNLSVEG